MRVKRVKNFPDYKVREDGAVASFKWKRRRLLRTNTLKGGHQQVKLYGPDKTTLSILVHHLVLEAFVGPCPPGKECRHLDGNPSNNHVSNLTWGTRLENMQDKVKHGTHNIGERAGRAILTEKQVLDIRKRAANGEKMTKLAIEHNVSHSTIWFAVTRRSWKHI